MTVDVYVSCLKRLGDGIISVHGDAEDVKGRHSGHVHVNRVVEVAHEGAEVPVTRDLHRGCQEEKYHKIEKDTRLLVDP